MKTQVFISDRLYIKAPDQEARMSHPLFQRVKQELTHLNPQYDTLQRLGKWTGNTPRYTIMWTNHEQTSEYFLGAPRGYREKLTLAAESTRTDLEWIDKTVCPELTEPLAHPTQPLDEFQDDALEVLLGYDNGCMEAPTGAGKTNILMSMIPFLQTPTLILVHTKELLMQTHRRLGEWLGIEAGILGGGKSKLKDVTVGMIQTLARMDIRQSGVGARFGAVIVDECHHSPAMTWAEILNRMQAKYRYGFTATAWRKDKLEFVIWDVIGEIRSKVSRQEVIDAGRIVWPTVEQVHTDYSYPIGDDSSKWIAMISDLIADEDRNILIEKQVRTRMWANTKALILTDRIDHANHLASRLTDLDPALLTGELTKREREETMTRVRAGAKLTVATIHLLGEGVDVPGWDLLFLVSPLSKGPRVMQALGRIARVAPGKDSATLIDFVDSEIPMLYAAAKGRMRLYRRSD
jgi:superfamily II DNA or RNA helicase